MRNSQEQKDEAAILDCYIELYANSEPRADFKELMDNAPINENDQKVIDFMAYEIDEKVYDNIVNSMIKKHKLRGYRVQMFKNTIALGCSPKFKKTRDE